MITLLATAIRLAILAAFVYAFIVLFECGPSGFVSGLRTEWDPLIGSLRALKSGSPEAPAP